MEQFYKIKRSDDLEIYVCEKENGEAIQVSKNNITISKGKFFSKQVITREEFISFYLSFEKKLKVSLEKI